MRAHILSISAIATCVLICATCGHARAQDVTSCTSSIRVLFNQYGNQRIQTGSTLWFSGVLESIQSTQNDVATNPVRIDVSHSQITFGKWPYSVDLPDSTIL